MNDQGTLVVSSDDLPKNDRFETWRETYARKKAGYQLSHIDQRPFFAQSSFHSLGSVKLARTTCTALRYRRGAREIAEDGSDGFAFDFCVNGRFELFQGRQRLVVTQQTATLVDHSLDLEGGVGPVAPGDYFKLSSVSLPRTELSRRVPKVERLLLTPVRDQGALRLLVTYLNSVEQQSLGQDPSLNRLIGEHILDIVGFLLGSQDKADRNDGGIHAARRVALVHYLEQNYREPNLSVDTIAASMKISKRYLYYLLDETGEGVTQMLIRLRLERARQLLADPKYGHLGIADIAFDSGFSDLSYFYRQFRRRFGETPGVSRGKRNVLPRDCREIPGPG